jgi:integrase
LLPEFNSPLCADPERATADLQGLSGPRTTRLPKIASPCGRRCKILLKLIYRLAEVAGVPDLHPHKFRHTFAIQYLRNGGYERTLQDVPGHESIDMLRTYTRIAQVGIVNGHQLASPVENWRL